MNRCRKRRVRRRSGTRGHHVGDVARDALGILAQDQLREDLFERALASSVRSSVTESSATTRPSWRMMTRVHSRSTTSRMCDVYRIALPRRARFATRWRNTSAAVTSSPESGSSKMSRSGSWSSAAITRISASSPLNRIRSRARRHRTARTVRGERRSCDRSRPAAARAAARPARGARGPKERIEMRFLRHVSEAPPELDRIEPGLAAVEEHRPARGLEQTRSACGSWSSCRPVRPEIADDFACMHRKAHVIDDRVSIESFHQASCFEHDGSCSFDLCSPPDGMSSAFGHSAPLYPGIGPVLAAICGQDTPTAGR